MVKVGRKILARLSIFLYKGYQLTRDWAKDKSSFVPYILRSSSSPSSTKIVHINGNFVVGGTSQLIVDIIERTSDKYFHKLVVQDLPDPIPYQPLSVVAFPLAKMRKLYEFLRDEKPALVHIQYWVRDISRYGLDAIWYEMVFRICEELQVRVIQNINVPTRPYVSPVIVHNVFVSNYVFREFNTGDSVRSTVIYPGSDFSHFRIENLEHLPDRTIGMVYRLDADKLNTDSIEVFICAVRKMPSLLCYIIGDGQYFNYYRRRVNDEGLVNNFVFTGMISYHELPEYYKKFGVFVAPVHDESFGQVTPFAMSMGLCIAGYNIGALSEILGYSDTLVEYGNIEGLADVIIDLVNDRKRRLKLAYINRERANSHFSVESMIRDYEEIYRIHLQDPAIT